MRGGKRETHSFQPINGIYRGRGQRGLAGWDHLGGLRRVTPLAEDSEISHPGKGRKFVGEKGQYGKYALPFVEPVPPYPATP